MSPLLEIHGLFAYYGKLEALHGIDVDVEQGQIVTIFGPNGAGKTTLLRAISGLVRVRGQVIFRGTPLVGERSASRARLGLAHVPEGRGTFAEMTVEENLKLGGYVLRGHALEQEMTRWLDVFPALGPKRRQLAGTLSGGEQQMLALARAMMCRPCLLLLDEPSAGLAPIITDEFFTLLFSMRNEYGLTVLLVEQRVGLGLESADRVYVLEAGEVVTSHATSELQDWDALTMSYRSEER